jgi:hypothetical protein
MAAMEARTSATERPALEDGRSWLLDRLARGVHPLDGMDPQAARETIGALEGLEPRPWTAAWGAQADRFAALARAAASAQEQRAAWMQAYHASFLGRYPTPNDPAKARQYALAREYFLAATALDDPPLEVVKLPFDGRAQEGLHVVFYVMRPARVVRPPVVMAWGGIDTWKEEVYARLGALFRSAGAAVLLIDMPGVGQSPVRAGRDAERQWTPIFEWLARNEDLDGGRCVAVGASFGGYWAMKLAHTHREFLRGAVNWGGGVHVTFGEQWQRRSRSAGSYLMDLMAARAAIFGGSSFEDYVASCGELSLLDQGLLDAPSAPLLLVNGRDDAQNSIEDLYLSLDHGDPKCARVFDGGHMGEGPVVPTIRQWVMERLAR